MECMTEKISSKVQSASNVIIISSQKIYNEPNSPWSQEDSFNNV